MRSTGTRGLPPLRTAGLIVALAVANVWFTAWTIAELIQYPTPVDWVLVTTAAERVSNGLDPYTFGGAEPFLWSPVAAWLFVPLSAVGPLIWRLLHFAALLLIPDRRVALVALVSWPFWFDVATGNVMTFVFVLALLALEGSRWASTGFAIVAVLIPRPLMVPVLAWLLWKRPDLRAPFGAIFVAHAVLVVASGWSAAWLARITTTTPQLVGISFDVSPGRFIGSWWIPIGVLLSVWFFTRKRLGLASLSLSPYWLPYYLIMPLLDLLSAARRSRHC